MVRTLLVLFVVCAGCTQPCMRVRVVDAESGQPLPGATVRQQYPSLQPLTAPVPPFVCTIWWDAPQAQTTNSDGRCQFEQEPARLRISQAGYESQLVRPPGLVRRAFSQSDEQTVKLHRKADADQGEPAEADLDP